MKNSTSIFDSICTEVKSKLYTINCENINSIDENIKVLFFLTQLMRSEILRNCELSENEIDCLIKKILNNLKEMKKKINPNPISLMNSDLGCLAFCIKEINKNTGCFERLLEQLNSELIGQSLKRIKMFKKGFTKDYYYDCLSGIAGVLSYFIVTKAEKSTLSEMTNYLISLTDNITISNQEIIGFYSNGSLIHKKNGYLDFGMAHGMAGVLMALSKAYAYGLRSERLLNAIQRIIFLIEEYSRRSKGVLQFPRRLSYKDYGESVCNNYTVNSGWCYGNLGIVTALVNTMINIKDYNGYEKYKKECALILQQPIENYNLSSPILCHGYGSVISMQTYLYRKTDDAIFLEGIVRNLEKEADSYFLEKENNENFEKDFSLLQGSAGSLLSMVNSMTMDLSYGQILLME